VTDGQHNGAPGAPPHDAPRPAPPESAASSSAPAAGAVKVPEGAFGVTLPTFDGPLDLLLTLIQEHKLDIFDIPISFVVDKYLEYMEAARALNIDLAGEYLLMGATLAYIKSRMLLPQGKSADGGPEGEVGPDPREELVRRLLEYQKYKHAAAMLARHPQLGRDVFIRRAKEELPLAPDEIAYMKSPEVSVYRLIEALARVLKERKIEIPHEVFVERLSIGDRIATITDRLRLEERITFTSLFEDLTQLDKHRVVPTFLAVLEMTKLKLLRVHQPDHHGEIYLSRSGALLTGAVEGVALDYRG
jgi:segregation and condensation protein A